jgi:hypothetical protein
MPYNPRSLENLRPAWKLGESGNPDGRAFGCYGYKRRYQGMMLAFGRAAEAGLITEEPAPVREKEIIEPWTPCNVCHHKNRAVIDGLLTLGTSLRAIARSYGFSKSSVDRHKQRHLPVFPDAEKAAQIVNGRGILHVPLLLLRQARYSRDADDIVKRLWEGFMSLPVHDPVDELRRVIFVAVVYLVRAQGEFEAKEDLQYALEVLESWGRDNGG